LDRSIEPIGKHAIYDHAAKHEETRYRRQHVITRALYEYTCSITHLCKQRIHYKLPRSSAIDKDYIIDKTNFNILRELNSLDRRFLHTVVCRTSFLFEISRY
jgi:hypothetical protein